MRVYSIASGSKGNVAYISTKTTNILIDVGLSMKQINEKLLMTDGIDLEDINLVLISHSHGDHIKAFYSIYVKYPNIKFGLDNALYLELCAYYEELKNKGKLKTYKGLDLDRFIFVEDEVKGNTLTLSTHPVQHDKHCLAWSIKELI